MRQHDTIILGAGFSGICAAIDLKRSGRESFVILEKGDGVGGTWRENTYPGVACDVPSHLYCYSFAPNPGWSRAYGTGAEIARYLDDCLDRFGIRPHLELGAAAVRAEWDDGAWTVTTAAGDVHRGRFLVAGLGGLHTPNLPDIPGLDTFGGTVLHTSRWRHDLDLHGKRVGMIGTGASAVQAAPEVAEQADRFTLFQRTPVWVGPKPDPAYTPEQQAAFAQEPQRLRQYRWVLWKAWETSGVDLFTPGSVTNRATEDAARRNITDHVDDPALAARLTPEYNITCKRPTVSDRYYPMFNRGNVELVTDPIDEITRSGVRCGDRRVDLDVIVLATGFQPFDITTEIDIRGLGGVSLREEWEERITSYRTVMAHRFPNLFILLGPNSAGLTSSVQMIEAGARFATRAISFVEAHPIAGLHPSRASTEAFTEKVAAVTAGTTANHGCVSWWTSSGTHVLWPESSISYRMMLEDFSPTDFDLVGA